MHELLLESVPVGLLGAQVGVAPPAEDRYAGLADLLRQLATFARDQGRLLVIRLDEIQNLTGEPLLQLLTLLGDLLEAQVATTTALRERVEEFLPVVVLLSGLTQFAQQAEDAGVTFSRRFATFFLDPFTDEEVRAGLTFAFGHGYDVLTDDGPENVTMQRLAHDPGGYRVVSRPLASHLADRLSS